MHVYTYEYIISLPLTSTMYMYMYICTCMYVHVCACSATYLHVMWYTCPYIILISAPPKVAEKPVLDPDKLSFKEKLALHKRNLEEQRASASSPVRPPLQPSSVREGYRRPITPELGVERPSEQAKQAEQANTHTCSSETEAKGEAQLSTLLTLGAHAQRGLR